MNITRKEQGSDVSSRLFLPEYCPLSMQSPHSAQKIQTPSYELTLCIPALHPDIVSKGAFDLDLVETVIQEAAERIREDFEEYHGYVLDSGYVRLDDSAKNSFDVSVSRSKNGTIRCNNFPLTNNLVINKDSISPFGGDHYIMIEQDADRRSHYVSNDTNIPQAFCDEYHATISSFGSHAIRIEFKDRGWKKHNGGSYALSYRRLLLEINNAHVRQKYAC